MPSPLHPLHPLHLALAPLLWGLWFAALYGGLSVGCAVVPPALEQGAFNLINASLLLGSLLVLALLLWLGARCWMAVRGAADAQARFTGRVAAGLYLLSAVSVLAIGLPLLALPPCV